MILYAFDVFSQEWVGVKVYIKNKGFFSRVTEDGKYLGKWETS